jgi:hypothetical protein
MCGLMLRRALSIALLLACSFPLFAGRVEFLVTREGEQVSGAEVCFFRGGEYGSLFDSFFSSSEVNCLPADRIIDLPASNWNIFARHDSGWISAAPTFQESSGDPPGKDGYASVELKMEPAGLLHLERVKSTLSDDESLFLYFANEELAVFSAVRPVPIEESTALVPAGVTVIPLIVANGRPRFAGDPVRVGAGETLIVDPSARRPALIADVQLDADWRTMDLLNQNAVSPPVLVLVDESGIAVAPLTPPRAGAGSHRSLLIFAPIRQGLHRLESRTSAWRVVSDRSIAIRSETEATVLDGRLLLRPLTEVRLTGLLDPSHHLLLATACSDANDPPSMTLEIVRCDGPDPKDCKPLSRQPFPDVPPFAAATWTATEAPEREHQAVLTIGDRMVIQRIPIEPLAKNDFVVEFGQRVVSGRIMMDGRPIAADVRFATGSATSDELGRYVALVSGDPGRAFVTVTPCGATRSYRFRPEIEITSGTILDIEVPGDTVAVRVSNADGQPMEALLIVMSLDPSSKEELFEVSETRTDASGRAGLRLIDTSQTLEVCAYAPEYKPACRDVKGSEEIRLILERTEEVGRGRVVLPQPQPIVAGRLYWVLPSGVVTEMMPVEPDGGFSFGSARTPGEYCVFVASRMPLFVFQPRPSDVATMTIHLPNVMVITIPVSLDASAGVSAGQLGLRINGGLVPNEAFSIHQQFSREHTLLTKARAVNIRNVAVTGTIEVLLAPIPTPDGRASWPDESFLQFAHTFPRMAVAPGTAVIFR